MNPKPAGSSRRSRLRWRSLLRVNLQTLILWLSIVAIAVALLNSFSASYRVQREVLIANTLDSNRAYAVKTAEIADIVLENASRELAFASMSLARTRDWLGDLPRELERVQQQSRSFNSALFISPDGEAQAIYPPMPGIVGRVLNSPAVQYALLVRTPQTSQPFVGATGRLIITLSHPVFNSAGDFVGSLVGSIYLHEDNVLHTLLTNQPYRNGSYLFVVDREGRLLYHPERQRIGEMVMLNKAVEAVITRSEAGQIEAPNTRGIPMLAGYAPMIRTGWGVIAQRPVEVTLLAQKSLLWATVRQTLPLLMALLLVIWALSRLISQPLAQMARAAERMDSHVAADRIAHVQAWYVEAMQLKRALLSGLASVDSLIRGLRQENATDPLTGLFNRRGVAALQEKLGEANTPFGVIVVDIDHFKQVNDVYGHDAGDRILQELAVHMRSISRTGDVLGRMGGEEFVMLLPDVSLAHTQAVAERLRAKMEHADTLVDGGVTVSLGVAHCPVHTSDPEEALRLADQALYAAKRNGRNQVCTTTATV